MNLRHKEIIGLSVETKSGQPLGQVSDFEYDSDLNRIVFFYVKGGNLVSSLISHPLIVSAEQVILITKEKMVVEDAVSKEKKTLSEPASV